MVEIILHRSALFWAVTLFLFGVAASRLMALRKGQTFDARMTWAFEAIAFILAALAVMVFYSLFVEK